MLPSISFSVINYTLTSKSVRTLSVMILELEVCEHYKAYVCLILKMFGHKISLFGHETTKFGEPFFFFGSLLAFYHKEAESRSYY